jgi:PhnB protein
MLQKQSSSASMPRHYTPPEPSTGRKMGHQEPHPIPRSGSALGQNRFMSQTTLSLMLAVPNTPRAVEWYQQALGAEVLWSMGSVAGLEINGAAFFLHEPVKETFSTPNDIGTTTVRIEVFVDSPAEVIARAIAAGATAGEIKDHQTPWGIHRQGGFTDPFGHIWQVGDRSPLNRLTS